MKKALLSLVLCCISIVGMAQTDVTKFLGIPVDGNKSDMMRKLKSKGFTQSPYAEDVLIGRFNGMDVNVHIATNHDKVCRIMVCDANTMDEASIRIRFNVLCEQFKNNSKYCSLSEEDPKLKEDENISYEMTVHKKRYEAIFYQLPDTTAANYTEEIQSLIYSKYTKEQIFEELKNILIEELEIAEQDIKQEANLFEDLDCKFHLLHLLLRCLSMQVNLYLPALKINTIFSY